MRLVIIPDISVGPNNTINDVIIVIANAIIVLKNSLSPKIALNEANGCNKLYISIHSLQCIHKETNKYLCDKIEK